jgi:hypothetical protein
MKNLYLRYLLTVVFLSSFFGEAFSQCSQSIVFPSSQSNAVTHINGASYSLGNGVLSLQHRKIGAGSAATVDISSAHQSPAFGIRTSVGSGTSTFATRTENELIFTEPVHNLRFDINDVDDGDRIRIFAYDETNTLIPFTASNYTLYPSTIITYTASPNQEFSTVVNTSDAGPESRITIDFDGLLVSRVIVAYYDTDSDGSTTIANITSFSMCANPDTFSGNQGGFTTPTVLSNDFHLTAAATSANTTASAVGTWPSGITMNSNGTITVGSAVASGVYNLTYRICSNTTSTNCATSTVSVTVLADTDGDLVPDYLDWDDDNDGIFDAVESPNCFYTSAEAHSIIKVTSPYNSASGDQFTTLHDLNTANGNPFNFAGSQTITSGSAVFNFEFPTSILMISLAINQSTNGMLSTTSRYGVLYASNDGVTYAAISASVQLHASPVTFSVTSTTPYRYYQIRYIGTASGGNATSATLGTANIQEISPTYTTTNYVPSANPKPEACISDTDSDGIPNHLDLDSDGDGCGDVIEGGANFTVGASYITNNRLNTPVNGNGVPGVPASTIGYTQTGGQTLDISQNRQINDCLDTDGDGVPNRSDLDNDNDGILDTDEGYCESQSVYTMDMAATLASANAAFNANGATFNLVYSLTSGSAADGLGTTFNIPFTYSDFINTATAQDHLWEGFNISGGTYLSIRPSVNPFLSGLPTNNTQTENISAAVPNEPDGRFRYLLNNGLIDRLGTYTTTIGNIPSTGQLSSISSFTPLQMRSVFNSVSGSGTTIINNGYFSKMQLQTNIRTDVNVAATLNYTTNYGQTDIWDYTALNDGLAGLVVNSGTRGLIDIRQNTITFCNHRDTDGDGIPDYLDLDSDNDACVDAQEADENITKAQLVNASGTLSVGFGSTASSQNLGNTVGATATTLGVPTIVNNGGAADIGGDVGQGAGSAYNSLVFPCCVNTAAPGTPDGYTKTGISNLEGFGTTGTGWPQNVPNGFIAIESKNKGFVITRVANTAAILNPVVGMLIYDNSANCVKLYTGTWKCLEKFCGF